MKTISLRKHTCEISRKTTGFSVQQPLCLFLLFSSFLSFSAYAQDKDSIQSKMVELNEVTVSSVRVTEKTPVTFSNLQQKEINTRNLGQDIPILMNYMPSVVTTSDAGNGVGYTGIRVRGSDASRVNVTINGIPYNDSESHGTFWVNMPDFASSLQSIQLQRGVGTSTNGAGAFGASLNMLTEAPSKVGGGEISNSYGSYDTRKHTVKFTTGLSDKGFELSGRLSKLNSDGYIDRASSDLKSYFLQGNYLGKTTSIKALVFGGKEITYQAWNGIDADRLKTNRRYNPSGKYKDINGNTQFYDNEVDNYQQDHAQLHWYENVSSDWKTHLAFHYTKGSGFYENYKFDEPVSGYPNINSTKIVEDWNGDLIPSTDLIRQKWLDNHFYGTVFSANYKKEKLDFIVGGGANKYEGDHFGKILWSRDASTYDISDKYYNDYATKTDGNIYTKANYQATEKLSVYGDLQFRNVNYKTNGGDPGVVNDHFNFFNPKAGLTYMLNTKNSIYTSYARANREPNRTDYETFKPKSEQLDDIELGWRYNSSKTVLNINGYYMKYKNQLVKTGELNDVGSEIRNNVKDSYRLGLEFDGRFTLSNKFVFVQNMTLSSNKIKDYKLNLYGEQVHYGNTNISFSPNVIATSILIYKPISSIQMSLMSKYVGEQYAGNIDTDITKLEAYEVVDFNVFYEIKTKSVFKTIAISGLVNNLLNAKYVSNAYLWGDSYMSYYPQATRNFLLGLQLKF